MTKLPTPDEFEDKLDSLVRRLEFRGTCTFDQMREGYADHYRALYSRMETAERDYGQEKDLRESIHALHLETLHRISELERASNDFARRIALGAEIITEQADRIRLYESLLSRCVPWLEAYEAQCPNPDAEHCAHKEVRTLLAELKEVKHG